MTVVAVTGASAGVGRATARAFAREGADVGLIARGRARLDSTKREIEAAGRRAVVAETDVADCDQVEAAAQRIEDELGPIDVWVNNAMATVFAPVKDTTPEEFRRATEVTYLGSVWGTMSALRRMRERDDVRLPAGVGIDQDALISRADALVAPLDQGELCVLRKRNRERSLAE